MRDRKEIARILQNMIDEAEENITNLSQAYCGYENLKNINDRKGDLAEAVALVEELNIDEPAEKWED